MNLDTCQNLYLTEFSHRDSAVGKAQVKISLVPFYGSSLVCLGSPSSLISKPVVRTNMGGAPSPFFQPREEAVFDSVCIEMKSTRGHGHFRVSSLPLLSREGFEYIWRSP